jgi:hypothetical protein
MDRLTENDRGTFLVTTRSGTQHTWVLSDEGVTVERNPSPESGHWSMHAFINGRPNHVTRVEAWPEVGSCFLYFMHGDIPWTRSSTVQSIERLAV